MVSSRFIYLYIEDQRTKECTSLEDLLLYEYLLSVLGWRGSSFRGKLESPSYEMIFNNHHPLNVLFLCM